ncbi:MAG: protein kinase, partial [Chitinophagaceae bacterium]|nr:protein kinase [Anaerolineae bacterium]
MSDLSIPTNQAIASTIGNRYRVIDKLGQGGMGVVFRAMDRLTGQKVALKQVVVAATELEFTTDGAASDSHEALLGLVTEFRTLSGLRHPNIISVLDYGFEIAPDTGESHPYFTMTLIEEAETVAAYTSDRDVSTKIGVLIEILQALAYLHRRGILHRDLKPGNVLVTPQGQVKVLDFGLALATNSDSQQQGEVMGTLSYMAPEVLWGKPTTTAADLYAVGVMAYEFITGIFPYGESPGQMVMNILNMPADLSRIADEALREVIGRLLEKEPLDRYENASEVIAAFSAAIGAPLPTESEAIRESFLQAADFVGRDEEVHRLRQALKTIVAAREGASFLIGGESGVGKSRLVDELRTLALIEGVSVLRGQGVAGGGLPYQLWREPLRRLALMVELSDLEAEILHEIVPDLPDLLERSIPQAPTVDAKSGQERLISTIVEVIHRVQHPVMLLLEDLQWMSESLGPLKQLNAVAKDFPLLIVGTFRDDERPNLPEELPNMGLMKLSRLSKEQIAALSYSMLGQAGERPEVLELLQRETEGNAFFAVEVVRALAEDVERLGDIGTKTLPASVFAQGIQSVIQRRLERVPESGREMLLLAAIMGRDLDLDVLQVLETIDLDQWLRDCADAAVLEVVDDHWRFAHEKLREGLLNAPNQEDFHRRVAQAIEQVHADDLAPYYADLTRHYNVTGDLEKERHFAALAGESAVARYANDQALIFLNRALALTPDTDALGRFTILLTREKIYIAQGARELREQDIQALLALANDLGVEQKAWAQERLANYHLDTGDYTATITAAQEAIQLAKTIDHQ